MQKVTPFLWFDNQAEEAMNFYTSIFRDAQKGEIVRNMPGSPGPQGSVMLANFTLNGQSFTALNGGPQFRFTEAVSFVISCEGQEEVDHYWNALTADGGQESQCGWLKDKFGLSWQVVPVELMRIMSNKEEDKASRAMRALMSMKKIDIAALEAAAAGE